MGQPFGRKTNTDEVLDPGSIATELGRHLPPGALDEMLANINRQLAEEGITGGHQWKSIPQGAATSVWAATVADKDEIGGRYAEGCHVDEIVSDDQPISLAQPGVRGYALDPDTAKALWAKSEEMVGERF